MKKKFLSSLLACLLAFSILPACQFLTPMESILDDFLSEESSKESSLDKESVSDDSSDSVEDSSSENEENKPPEDIVTAEMSIHFLYFGNLVSGDCTLIKVGDTEVLIDAGSTRGAVRTTVPYIQQYCTDGILEYVVATHAHSDHISGFIGLEAEDRDSPEDGRGVFEVFECQTIIDYTARKTTSALSKEYETARDKEVLDHGGNHYTALECWNNENGAKRSYELGAGITMNILYQKYYTEKATNENNYSVCIMISQGDNHYLFTGDLESAGEKSLVDNNDLPKCKVYKGGHHGSRTSSSNDLLSVIQPEIVCVCSCCGDQNGFVHQEFIDRIAPYTDRVYVTTMKYIVDSANNIGNPMPLNGNIAVICNGLDVEVKCSNNNLLFKDTDWFKANRTCPEAWKAFATGE